MALIRRNTAYSLNDIVYTTFGVKLKCITAGTTDINPLNLPPPHSYISIIDGTVTWEIVEENHVAIGTIISYMGNAVPERFLACDGTIYNINDYQSLADHINIEFGSYNHFGGDGTTTFAVPDLRGEFLRGTGTSTRSVGSGDSVGMHQDPTYLNNIFTDDVGDICFYTTDNNSRPNQGVRNIDSRKTYSGNPWLVWTSKTGVSTTSNGFSHMSIRPTNTSVLYCIKYI